MGPSWKACASRATTRTAATSRAWRSTPLARCARGAMPTSRTSVDAAKAKHQPVVDGECTKCHSPHQTALERLLLAKSPDLCLSCHKDVKASLDEGHVHSPAARDCLRCHKPHASAEDRLMVQPVRTLCADCHDLKARGVQHGPPADRPCADSMRTLPRRARLEGARGSSRATPTRRSPMKSCQDCHIAPRAEKR